MTAMKNIYFTVTTQVCILYYVYLTVVDCEIVVPPVNTVGFVGNRTVFHCEISLTVQQWEENYSSRDDRVISVNAGITPDYSSRYGVEGEDSKYNLVVLTTQYTEAGTHKCTDIVDVTGPNKSKSAELFVLDSNPSCTTNSSDVENVLIEGEYVRFTCSVRYAGLWGPKMTWTTDTGTTINAYDESDDTLDPKLVQNFYTTVVTSRINKQFIQVKTTFDPPTMPPANSALNAPDYLYVWSSPSILVHYPPRAIVFKHCADTVCNSIGDNDQLIKIHPGDRILAHAAANPSIDYYLWKNFTDIIQEGVDLNELSFKNAEFSTIECIVRNTMRGGVQKTMSRTILVNPETTTVTKQSTEGSSSTVSTPTQGSPCEPCAQYNGIESGSIAGIAIGTFLIGALIPTILLVIECRSQKKHQDSNKSPNTSTFSTNPVTNLCTTEAMSTGTMNRGAYEDLDLSPYLNTREGRPENNVYQGVNREETPYEQV